MGVLPGLQAKLDKLATFQKIVDKSVFQDPSSTALSRLVFGRWRRLKLSGEAVFWPFFWTKKSQGRREICSGC
jgi:hypothetical protein